MSNNAVAKKDPVGALMESVKEEVMAAVPNAVTKQAYLRALQTSLRKTPKLMQCNQASLRVAIMDSAQFGLVLGYTGHLIPYGKECQLIVDYKGMLEMAFRSGEIDSIDGDVVCENDKFEYERGIDPVLQHKPTLRDRGKPYAVYAIAWLKGATKPVMEVMSFDEIEAIRAGRKGPWNDYWGEMAKKTVFKRICKRIPRSIELQAAVTFDNQQEERYREVQADIVDPLEAGEHSHSAKMQDPEKKAPPKKKKNVSLVIYDRFIQLYGEFPVEVDECLVEAGLPSMMEIDRGNVAADDAEIWKNAKDLYMAKHNTGE